MTVCHSFVMRVYRRSRHVRRRFESVVSRRRSTPVSYVDHLTRYVIDARLRIPAPKNSAPLLAVGGLGSETKISLTTDSTDVPKNKMFFRS